MPKQILTRKVKGKTEYYCGTGLWTETPDSRMQYDDADGAAQVRSMLVREGFGKPEDPPIKSSKDGEEDLP